MVLGEVVGDEEELVKTKAAAGGEEPPGLGQDTALPLVGFEGDGDITIFRDGAVVTTLLTGTGPPNQDRV